MKAITLYQPYASLLIWREKRIETRSWKHSYRGELAIHAGATFPKWAKELCYTEPFKSVLMLHGITSPEQLPLAAVLGKTQLVAMVEMTPETIGGLTPNELAFGDYTLGRFMWVTTGSKEYVTPIPAKGKQGLWNWDGGAANA